MVHRNCVSQRGRERTEKGIATEATRAVVIFGFKNLGFPYLTSGYFEDNPALGKVLSKLGFVETGRVMRCR